MSHAADILDPVRMVQSDHAQMELLRAGGDSDGDGGWTLVGYAATFDTWTEINSAWEGHFMERFSPGAFTKTLRERGDKVKVLYNHGFDPQIGQKPLGKPTLIEQRKGGLWTETPLVRTDYNETLQALLEAGVLDGMSIRFLPQKEEWIDDPGPSDHNPLGLSERTHHEVRLVEFGPVTFPAYEATTAGVRGEVAYRAYDLTRQSITQSGLAAGETATPNPIAIPDLEPPARHSTRAERQKIAIARRHAIHQIRKGNR